MKFTHHKKYSMGQITRRTKKKNSKTLRNMTIRNRPTKSIRFEINYTRIYLMQVNIRRHNGNVLPK